MKDMQGKVAVVTGAASGIGRAMAEKFAAAGMKIVLADIEQKALDEVTAGFKARTIPALAVVTDTSKVSDLEALANKAYDTFGAVHVLCNNAGVGAAGPMWEISTGDWDWVLGVNLWGVIHGVRIFVPRMLAQDSEGHIVNTASMAGLVAGAGMAPYNVAKFGVVALSETLNFDLALAGAKLKVSVLCPGWVRTRILDSERNRPATAGPARRRTEMEQAMEGMVRNLIAGGLDPAQVADLVVDAIRNERFYILPHGDFLGLLSNRMKNLLAGDNPTMAGFA